MGGALPKLVIDLDLTVNVDDNIITSTATLTAVATSTLAAFNLDFHALEIDALSVNGVETPYQRQEDELIIDPAASSEDLGWVLEAWAGR